MKELNYLKSKRETVLKCMSKKDSHEGHKSKKIKNKIKIISITEINSFGSVHVGVQFLYFNLVNGSTSIFIFRYSITDISQSDITNSSTFSKSYCTY